MSMFDWSAPAGQKVVSHRFWVYWAFTVPITVVLLVIGLIWWFVFVRVKDQAKEVHSEGSDASIDPPHPPETPFQDFQRRRTERLAEKEIVEPQSTRPSAIFGRAFQRRKESEPEKRMEAPGTV